MIIHTKLQRNRAVPSILVVDDSPMDRMRVGRFLQQEHPNYRISYAEDGLDALSQIKQSQPDVIITDMQMPAMDGFELVHAVKEHYPLIPVILITSKGSEEVAARALREGAVSYVPKSVLATSLAETIERTLDASYRDRAHSRLMHSLTLCRTTYSLQNDPELIELLVPFYEEMLRSLPLRDEGERLRCGEALKHAICHVWHFGSLEIDPQIPDSETLERIVRDRITEPPFAEREVLIEAEITPEQARFRIRHSGGRLNRPELEHRVAANDSPFLRGLLLMESSMDQVDFSDDGLCVTLVKTAQPSETLDVVSVE